MAKAMVARYPGRCYRCGGHIVRGEAIVHAGRRVTYHAGCSDDMERSPRINVIRFASGATEYRNSRGRCEDAPCCGCCTI